MAVAAGLQSKCAPQGQVFQVVNRIAVEELEAWFFGDWSALQAAYPRVPATIPQKARFRDPDAIVGGTAHGAPSQYVAQFSSIYRRRNGCIVMGYS